MKDLIMRIPITALTGVLLCAASPVAKALPISIADIYGEVQTFVPDPAVENTGRFGSIAIEQLGDFLFIGLPNWSTATQTPGRVRIYERDRATGEWTWKQSIGPFNDANSDHFGASLATIVLDGIPHLAIAAPNRIYGNNGQWQGYVWLYRYNPVSGNWQNGGFVSAPEEGVPFAADVEFLAGGTNTLSDPVGSPMLIVTAPSMGRVYGYAYTGTFFAPSAPAITQDLTAPGEMGPIDGNGNYLFLQNLEPTDRMVLETYALRTNAAINPFDTDYQLNLVADWNYFTIGPDSEISVSTTPSTVDRSLPDTNPINRAVPNGQFLMATGSPDHSEVGIRQSTCRVSRITTTSVYSQPYGYAAGGIELLATLNPPSNGVTYVDFFSAVSISPDGSLIAVAAQVDGSSGGFTDPLEVHLYERTGDASWDYAGPLAGSASRRDQTGFGAPVEFGEDGQLYLGDWSNSDENPANAHGRVYEFGADWSGNATAIADELRGLLYPGFATPPQDPATAAFRYVDHLYRPDTQPFESSPELAAAEFGPAEEAALQPVLDTLAIALNSTDPQPELQDLLLDIYYDWSRIKTIQAGERMVEADFLRVDVPAGSPGGLILADEIAAVSAALTLQREAVDTWLRVLTDNAPVGGGTPPGFLALQDLGTTRQLVSPEVLIGGVRTPVVPTSPLLAGYKDLVYLLEALSDEAEATSRLGLLHALDGDPATAAAVIAEGSRRAAMFSLVARGPYPATPPDAPTGDALAQGEADFREGRLQLLDVRELLDSDRNILGFDRDFLLILGKPGSQHTDLIHSFDTMLARLESTSTLVNPVLRAEASQQTALAAWDNYQSTSDAVEIELANLESTLGERITQVVGDGALPPTEDPASEIYNQSLNIERAQQRIIRNGADIDNLRVAMTIEFNRIEAEIGILNARQSILIDYGNRRAAITEQIAYVEALQSGAEAFSDVGSPEEFVAAALSGIVSAGAGVSKGQLEAERDRLAAQEQAALISNDIRLAGNNGMARIATMYLEMNLLAIDSLDAAILLDQEIGRLTALVREQQRLEARLELSTQALAGRFFADPVHRYRARHAIFLANEDFERAREFLFFLIRAYEYKHNRTFNVEGWDLPTFFKLRNASELGRLAADLIQDGLFSEPSYGDRFSWFSVRNDFFRFVPAGDPDDPSDPIHALSENLYTDPLSGTGVTYHEAFQSQLQSLLRVVDVNGNGVAIPPGANPLDPAYPNVQLIIPFSTTRDRAGDLFFDRQTHADKIIALHVNVPGLHTLGRSTVSGTLILSGTSFMRNPSPGTVPDPNRPDQLVGEMRAFPVREWSVADGAWAYVDEQRERITISLTPDDRIPPSALSIDAFNERSVAASNWELRVDIREDGINLVNPGEIRDLEIYFHHASISRD